MLQVSLCTLLVLLTDSQIVYLTLKCPGGQMDPPIGFSDLKFEAFKQSN